MAGEGWAGGLRRLITADRRRSVIAAAVVVLVGASVALAASQSGSRQGASAIAVPGSGTAFSSDPERARMEKIVRDYILAHPEIIREAATLLEQRDLTKAIDDNRALFETPFASAWAGAENGDVVLVEFFDYACGYCRASNPEVDRLLKEDKRLKVVWRELPVLGPESVAAAHASLAAARQGKFRQFYERLFAAGAPSESTVAQVQRAVGAAAGQSPAFQQEIDKNFELARSIGVSGTPVFVVGDKVLQGAVGYEVLKKAVAAARDRS
jgi:protein-disulfide isomerase